jgi:hypothetical protein
MRKKTQQDHQGGLRFWIKNDKAKIKKKMMAKKRILSI